MKRLLIKTKQGYFSFDVPKYKYYLQLKVMNDDIDIDSAVKFLINIRLKRNLKTLTEEEILNLNYTLFAYILQTIITHSTNINTNSINDLSKYDDVTLEQYSMLDIMIVKNEIDVLEFLNILTGISKEDILNYDSNYVFNRLNDFKLWKENLIKDNPLLFKKLNDDNIDKDIDENELKKDTIFKTQMSWYRLAYNLSNKDILKINEIWKLKIKDVFSHNNFLILENNNK